MTRFEWDRHKDSANRKKHGVSLGLARLIFNDPNIISVLDARFDYGEERWISIGAVRSLTVLVVAHAARKDNDGEEVIRVISARSATRDEAKLYLRGVVRNA